VRWQESYRGEKEKYEETVSYARNHVYAKTRQKKRGQGEEREKRYDWIQVYFEEIIHWECSFYV
jgi:hypothetical protein